MAIFFPGKSICLLCGNIIASNGEVIGFTAFLKNTHRLHLYSDGLFHKSCYEHWDEKEEFDRLYQKFCDIWATRPGNLKTREEIDAWGREAFREFDEEIV